MREEQKANRSLKEAAKKNDKESCLILAKEIVNARKVIRKLQLSKTQLNSIQMQMRNQLCKFAIICFYFNSTSRMLHGAISIFIINNNCISYMFKLDSVICTYLRCNIKKCHLS